MMKKTIILFWLITANILLYAQQQPISNVGITQPNPTASSISSYANVPVSYQTGVPNISYDLLSVPTNNKKVNVKLGLNYHSGGIGTSQWIGDMGQGWSLLGLGAISREIHADVDERYNQSFAQWYKKNTFDDIYNFSISDESGRFRFVRDTISNTFSMLPLSDFDSKIEYERTSDNLTLVLKSLTITGNSGIKYKFSIFDTSIQSNVLMHYYMKHVKGKNGADSLVSVPTYRDIDYRSTFRLTSIMDENNNEIVKYNYDPYTYENGFGTAQKIKSIEIKDRGIIEFTYNTEAYPADRKHDKFSIASIVLKDRNNHQIQKYIFTYEGNTSSNGDPTLEPRQLKSFSKVGWDNLTTEKTEFTYTLLKYLIKPYQNLYTYFWHINSSVLPTGGKMEYDFGFEPNFLSEYESNIPKYVDLPSVSFSAFNAVDKKNFFTLNENKDVRISLQTQVPGQFWEVKLYKKEGSNYNLIPETLGYFNQTMEITLTSGEYFATLEYGRSNTPAFSEDAVFGASYRDGFIKYPEASEKGFLRINSIKYYKDKNAVLPDLFETYSYQDFNDNSKSSGYIVDNCLYAGFGLAENTPLVRVYKNIKVSTNKGYTKYYYKIPDDFPTIQVGNRPQIQNYFSVQTGILDKSEIYDQNNQKIQEKKYEYNFIDFGAYFPQPEYNINIDDPVYQLSYTQKEKVITRDFFPTDKVETQKETIRNNVTSQNRNNVKSEKEIDSYGGIVETSYQYAHEKGNQLMISKNMIGIPLETVSTQTIGNSTKTLSKSETIYPLNQTEANTKTSGLVLPTSVLSYDLQNPTVSTTEVLYDKYDSKGNLQQYTTKDGVSTVIIWGYNTTKPIAKIEGAKLADINPSVINAIVSASDTDGAAGANNDETNLLNAFNTFRNTLSGYQITTYSYDPLIGVRSITPPSGIRESYIYDAAGRLEMVIDANGKVLKEMKYNYKN
ncbi:RHS repeat domain-containing protein [Chryseobacterium sp. NRRL B-14859]|uniref:RHS repeat domain-containing protein n=1 Tax=Chryseobacterium sp. NRRL B-14859 TaxID=1562763 RepID=UPI0033923AAA